MNTEWLNEFFSGDNKINLGKIMTGQYGQVYIDMMNPVISAAKEQRWPVILPFKNSVLKFYAAAQDERRLLELRRILEANLGSADTYLDLPIIRSGSNSSEKALLKHAPNGLICIKMLVEARDDLEAKKRVFFAFRRILSLYEQRPLLQEHIQRPLGRILREFYTACKVEDEKTAKNLFKELKTSGKLSERNLLFLNFQALKAGKKWNAILEHDQLSSCLKGRIPLQVLRLLLQAFAHRCRSLLDDDFSSTDRDSVWQESQSLITIFTVPPPLHELKNVTSEWKAWAIGAALNGFSEIEQYLNDYIDPSWLNDLLSWAGAKVQNSDQIPSLLQVPTLETNVQSAKELLQYALLAPNDEIVDIVAKLSEMPDSVAEEIAKVPILHQHWINLKALYFQKEYGWNKWFTEICENEEQTDELTQLATNKCLEWASDTFDPGVIQQCLDAPDNSKAGEALRDVMPLMLEWLQDREIKCPDSFWVKLIELLALDDFANRQDIQLTGAVLEGLFRGSYSLKSYEDALQAVEMLLEKVNSIQSYDAVLEMMDMVLDNSCPSPRAQQSLWHNVQQFAFRKWTRLTPILKKLTKLFAQELLGDDAEKAFAQFTTPEFHDEEAGEHYPDLSGKVLAIYSLTEGAAKRAKELLESLFDGIIIRLNHDHVATSSLENLAKTAEYFVFAAKSAKHQAFYTVKNLRSDIIYPQGKGASSIVREFVSKVCVLDV
jgi:hypothetical protein